jgi:AcrR family transcriptional regulator
MKKAEPRPRGRPRLFDRDQVLDSAITVFWARGYDGASIEDLTQAMGIKRPSLYATFGSKHGLFMAAIDRYAATHGNRAFRAFQNEPDLRSAVAAFFETSIRCATLKGKPRGCLVASVATEVAQDDSVVRDKLSEMFARTDEAIADRFRADQGKRQVRGSKGPVAVARMVVSVTHSIATRARIGASRKELSNLADDFMSVLFSAP